MVAGIYREAAAIMERDGYGKLADVDKAIGVAAGERWSGTSHRSYINRMLPRMAFCDMFGCWINDDEGILMLCFAACAAETGDMT